MFTGRTGRVTALPEPKGYPASRGPWLRPRRLRETWTPTRTTPSALPRCTRKISTVAERERRERHRKLREQSSVVETERLRSRRQID